MNAAVVQRGNQTSSNDGYHFKSTDHFTSGFQEMLNMQRNGKLCDIVITVGGEVHRAHKLVFASASKYFSDLFDDKEGKVAIGIDDITPEALRSILLFFYTGEITITVSNVQDLLVASKRFKIAKLKAACGESMSKLLNPTNWIQIIAIARAQQCGDLYEKCHAYAVQHFEDIVKNESFLQLPFCEVKELIKDGELIVRSEVEVYSAVLNWVKHDLPNRGPNLSELMVYVKFPLIDKTYFLNNVINEPLMTENLECSKLLLQATKSHFGAQCEKSSAKVLPRKYLKEHFIFVAGGGNRNTYEMSECEIYNPRSNTWHSFSPMLCKRSKHGLVGFRRLLYAFGGFDGDTFSSVEYYDPLKDSWAMTTSLPNGRFAHGACSIDNSIYLCGGRDKAHKYLNSVDKFDPVTATYMTSPPMKTSRSHFNMAVSDNCIYAIAGDTDGYQPLNSMEIFDPREGKWSEAPSKSIPGIFQSVAVLDGFIYTSPPTGVLGCDWERFNIRRNAWEVVSNTSNEQDHVNHDGCLYMLGSCIKSIQKYDPNKNSVIQMPPMINERRRISAVMMDSIEIKDLIKLNDS